MTTRLQLDDKWSALLCGLPETGMGYQCVDVFLRDGQCVKDVLVFNAQVMEWTHHRSIQSEDIVNIIPAKQEERA